MVYLVESRGESTFVDSHEISVKILFINQQFQTSVGCSIIRGYEFVRCLQRFGHDVSVLCSGIATEEALALKRGQVFSTTEIDGIHCTSVAAGWGSPIAITKIHPYRRMLGFLNFARVAAKIGKTLPPPDVVYASSPPLPVGLAGRRLARHFRVPFVFEVRDPWPQALIDLGALRNRVGIAWMRRMEQRIYASADHFVALSPGIKQAILAPGDKTKFIDERQVTVVPNASDLQLFDPRMDRTLGRAKLGLNDEFAVIYFGAMGMANGLDYLLDAAKILKQRGNRRVKFLMVGTGGGRNHLEERIRREELDNVRLSNPVPRTELPELVSACDVCLTIIRPSTSNPTWSPNKLFDSLAAGRPVVANVEGWIAELIERNECGRVTNPHAPQSLANALEDLADDPTLCQLLGRNARRLAENNFSREKLAKQLEGALQQSCSRSEFVDVPIRVENSNAERCLAPSTPIPGDQT